MAILGKYMNGTAGNVVFYESRGKQVMRAKPGRIKQTKATKASAKDFGRAARFSRLFREVLEEYGKFNRLDQMCRMNRVLMKWISDSKDDPKMKNRMIQSMVGFELNPESELRRNFKVTTLIDFDQPEKILVTLPEIKPAEDISAPPWIDKVQLNIISVRVNTNEKMENRAQPLYAHNKIIEIDYTKASIPEQQIELPQETIPDDIVLLAIGLTYFKSSVIKDKKWVPAGIVGAKYCE
jgi:hypothetical protein